MSAISMLCVSLWFLLEKKLCTFKIRSYQDFMSLLILNPLTFFTCWHCRSLSVSMIGCIHYTNAIMKNCVQYDNMLLISLIIFKNIFFGLILWNLYYIVKKIIVMSVTEIVFSSNCLFANGLFIEDFIW